MGEQLWTDTWNMFDGERSGKISKEDFMHAFRACGQKPSQKEAEEILAGVSDPATFDEFKAAMGKGPVGPSEADLINSLNAFDGTDSGFLKKSDIHQMLTQLGEPLEDGQVDTMWAFVGAAVDGEGKIDIKAFAAALQKDVPPKIPDMEELAKEMDISM
eukprot:NODE_10763_length_577_cov_104.955947_g10486_i0.p1 GENE.NODE_10763_length_577_cov_104.955947_g10486_i0~~NODE_10763_length_577_cov_104.955947_g10486_i0.p1  ORF type:complete len:159 (+),score=40.19 NODE_10763_length_577_cov_104.955947_g10486_i0:80-556(+)